MNATKKNNGFYEEVSENGYMLPQIQKIKADYNNRLTQIEEDFKKTVVKLYETGKGVSELSREYGVGKSTIESWIKKFKTITTSTGEKTNNDEILRLQKKNKELEQEIEILKKAVAIFSKKQMTK